MRLLVLALLSVGAAQAADLTHQGRLADSTGAPISGATNLTITLWSAASEGTDLSVHAFSGLDIQNGYYSVLLTGVPESSLVGDVWVEVGIVGQGALLPRTKIGATPRAVVASALVARPSSGVDASHTALSCKALHAAYPDLPSASYWLDLDGSASSFSPMQAYCDMGFRGGGWTLCYEGDAAWGGVTVTGWHNRLNTTARGSGEYGRGCRDMTGQFTAPEARLIYIDTSYIEARHDAAPSLNNGGFWEFNAIVGPSSIGIEIENPGNPGRGHCFNDASEDNSWGRAGTNASCFLDTSATGWYSGLRHVEYWLRRGARLQCIPGPAGVVGVRSNDLYDCTGAAGARRVDG